jgi:hypothetical protein
LLAIIVLTACGGGGGGGIAQPSGLSYAQPPAFVINQAITPLTPTVMGQVTSYTVTPALPKGLTLNSATGAISGTPTAIAAGANYATVIAEIFYPTPNSGCATQVIPTSGGATIYCDNTIILSPSALQDMQLSPDGTLLATSPSAGGLVTTNIYKNGTLVSAVPGALVGWLDNTRLLVNDYINAGMAGIEAAGTTIYDSLGNKLGNPPILNLAPFQAVTSDSVYLPTSYSQGGYSVGANSIESLTTGTLTWASGNSSPGPGAVGGSQIVFASGNLVLAQPY